MYKRYILNQRFLTISNIYGIFSGTTTIIVPNVLSSKLAKHYDNGRLNVYLIIYLKFLNLKIAHQSQKYCNYFHLLELFCRCILCNACHVLILSMLNMLCIFSLNCILHTF